VMLVQVPIAIISGIEGLARKHIAHAENSSQNEAYKQVEFLIGFHRLLGNISAIHLPAEPKLRLLPKPHLGILLRDGKIKLFVNFNVSFAPRKVDHIIRQAVKKLLLLT